MNNCILLVSAVDGWDGEEHWRRAAEYAYANSLRDATQTSDTTALEAPKHLRHELDDLSEKTMEDLTGMTKEERGMDVNDAEWETDVDAAKGKTELKGLHVPSVSPNPRLPKGPSNTRAPHLRITVPPAGRGSPAIPSPLLTARSLRRIKSSQFIKGGACNAHRFARSLQKTPSADQEQYNQMDDEYIDRSRSQLSHQCKKTTT